MSNNKSAKNNKKVVVVSDLNVNSDNHSDNHQLKVNADLININDNFNLISEDDTDLTINQNTKNNEFAERIYKMSFRNNLFSAERFCTNIVMTRECKNAQQIIDNLTYIVKKYNLLSLISKNRFHTKRRFFEHFDYMKKSHRLSKNDVSFKNYCEKLSIEAKTCEVKMS